MTDTLSWFPMYHGDYLRDTPDLSPAEHGVYLLLLMAFVSRGPLPDDLNRLCRIAAGAEPQDVRHILERYWILQDDGWVNGKMARVLEIQQERHQRRVLAGRKGGLKKASNASSNAKAMPLANTKQCSTNQNQNHIATNVAIDRGRKFFPPSVSEVTEYCRERGNSVDPQNFVDHYEANGWMRGKNKVKDWKACVRTWEKSNATHKRNRAEVMHDTLRAIAAEDMGGNAVRQDAGEIRAQVVGSLPNRADDPPGD